MSVAVSDPARDYLTFLNLLQGATAETVAERISSVARVTIWTRDFYKSLQLLQQTIDYVNDALVHDEYIDQTDQDHLANDIERIRSLFRREYINARWETSSAQGGPAGPESLTFLRSASRQMRSTASYGVLTEQDVELIQGAIDMIRSDFGSVRLEKADFAREALLRGCEDVSFIVARIDVFGFSRLEAPVMELGAFLYTVAEDVRRRDGDDRSIRRSMASLSKVYHRLYELSKIGSLAKVGYDGAQ